MSAAETAERPEGVCTCTPLERAYGIIAADCTYDGPALAAELQAIRERRTRAS